MSLEKYKVGSQCKKCGARDASTRYHPEEVFAFPWTKQIIKYPEYIKRVCHVCGHVWEELPLDCASENSKPGWTDKIRPDYGDTNQ